MYFAQGSESNRLFANDQSFKEGDLVANGWRLTAIGIDGIEDGKAKPFGIYCLPLNSITFK
jgi:hypothetical protein